MEHTFVQQKYLHAHSQLFCITDFIHTMQSGRVEQVCKEPLITMIVICQCQHLFVLCLFSFWESHLRKLYVGVFLFEHFRWAECLHIGYVVVKVYAGGGQWKVESKASNPDPLVYRTTRNVPCESVFERQTLENKESKVCLPKKQRERERESKDPFLRLHSFPFSCQKLLPYFSFLFQNLF